MIILNINFQIESETGPKKNVQAAVQQDITPFEQLSIDPLMPIQTAAWIGSKKIVTLYPLLAKCINTGNIDVSIMEDNTTRSVLLTLLCLEARFAIKISLLSTDAGTNLIKENLNPKLRTERTEHLFNMLSQCHTSLPRSQWTNYSESSTRQVKLYLKKALNMTKESTLPQLQRDEWKFLFDVIALELNSVPFLTDKKGYLLSPSDFLYLGRQFEARIGEVKSHFKNINDMMQSLSKYHQLLRDEMMDNMRNEWTRYQQKINPKGKNSKRSPNNGDIVCWSPEFNKIEYGVIKEVSDNKAIIRQKNGEILTQSLANLTPLVVVPWERTENST